MAHLNIKDTFQGYDLRDRPYGYCGIDERGGQFFTHCDALAETLASIEDDEINPPVDWPQRAYQEVRGFVRRQWTRGAINPRRGLTTRS